jgi:hypothetical protein
MNLQRCSGRLLCYCTLLITFVITWGSYSLPVAAQSGEQWLPPSTQQRIPGYSQAVFTPRLVADQNRTVHVFASDSVGDIDPQVAIIYRRWTLDQGWTTPTDILLSPIKEARIQGALLDQAGTMHVAFFGGIDPLGDIYYAKAPAILAYQAHAWSAPVVVGPQAITPDDAELVSNRQGHLYIIYSGGAEGSGIYETHTDDNGDSWSEPVPIFNTYDEGLLPWHLQTCVDEEGAIHLVWAVQNKTSGNAVTVNYAKLEEGREAWNTPIILAQIDGTPSGAPSIIAYQHELFVIHFAPNSEGTSMTRYMRRSSDGGQTWTEPTHLFPHIGNNGPASLVVDSSNTMHMFFGNRMTTETEINWGLWHTVWQSGRWSSPQAIVFGPKTDYFDPVEAHAISSQGNVILVTWMNDYGTISLGTGGTFYAYTVLDAPELPLVSLPTQGPTPTNEPMPTPTQVIPTSTSEPHAKYGALRATQTMQSSSATLLIISTFPVALLILVVVGVRRFSHQSHR